MKEHISREKALALLKKYNQDAFHIQHALTVEAVMKWYAKELGYEEDAEYRALSGFCMILTSNNIRRSTASRHRSFCQRAVFPKI